ncbi:NADH/NAD(+) kinase NDAI_0G00290 [Naumovozyma dairenensis CBS 421]|uniref:NAD+ kinase n=1 Tax=Naumovozyma dairenensis (strain ATCC 10597 / BCRC 20456 / CBS 421 / NBRC 0211 / NRRL Y-12639) TaxID=1071378 RepID=G0WDE4_NAUDC|nr:hypothetical protein NDAI_0G00290 [Naumovozyma dairenensis CBS 421]CCD25805.2 hypothetical protein NDAI_0G00290 [Naumovozyma dairenensis CBS 421]
MAITSDLKTGTSLHSKDNRIMSSTNLRRNDSEATTAVGSSDQLLATSQMHHYGRNEDESGYNSVGHDDRRCVTKILKPDGREIILKGNLHSRDDSDDVSELTSSKQDELETTREIIRTISNNRKKQTEEDALQDNEGDEKYTMKHRSSSSAKSKQHLEFVSTAYGVRLLSKNLTKTKVSLNVENLILVTKISDVSLIYLTRELVEWLLITFPNLVVYVEDDFKKSSQFAAKEICHDTNCTEARIKYWNSELVKKNNDLFDLCITLGGDGTVLFVSSLFQKSVPPTVSFSLGSLGFLTNFNFEYFKQDLRKILERKIKINLRMRLECKIYHRHKPKYDHKTGKKICIMELMSTHHVLNEVIIDRGTSPFISMLELFGDGSLMTVAQADGLIVATPTGSTAYSLSAGGALMYPSINAISVTPVCPHTLSFRPIVLPENMNLKVKVSLKSRGTAWASFDGKGRFELQKGDYVTISASPYAFPTVESSPNEFFDGINRTLNWNVRDQQKSFTHMLSLKNRKKLATEHKDANILDTDEEDIIEKRIDNTTFLKTFSSSSDDDEDDSIVENEIENYSGAITDEVADDLHAFNGDVDEVRQLETY